MSTNAPASDSASDVAAPIPLAPPVTIATLPWSSTEHLLRSTGSSPDLAIDARSEQSARGGSLGPSARVVSAAHVLEPQAFVALLAADAARGLRQRQEPLERYRRAAIDARSVAA